jgi:hypothetical protein
MRNRMRLNIVCAAQIASDNLAAGCAATMNFILPPIIGESPARQLSPAE